MGVERREVEAVDKEEDLLEETVENLQNTAQKAVNTINILSITLSFMRKVNKIFYKTLIFLLFIKNKCIKEFSFFIKPSWCLQYVEEMVNTSSRKSKMDLDQTHTYWWDFYPKENNRNQCCTSYTRLQYRLCIFISFPSLCMFITKYLNGSTCLLHLF